MLLNILTLITFIAKLLSAQKPSPCPEVFSYEPKGAEEDRWYGVISLQTQEELNGIWLHVLLDRPAELLGNWFGQASSSDNEDYAIKNPKYKLVPGPPVTVRLFVKYNAASIVPSIKTIRLNGKTICQEKRQPKPAITTTPEPYLSEEIKPNNGDNGRQPVIRPGSVGNNNGRPNRPSFIPETGQPTVGNTQNGRRQPVIEGNDGVGIDSSDTLPVLNGDDGGDEVFAGDYAIINRPTLIKPATDPIQIQNRNVGCGTVAMRASPLISFGQNTSKGQWPWHVAIYHSQGIQLVYTCGGTLLNENYVLTASHCVTRPQTNRPINKSSLVLYFGKYHLRKFGPEVLDREISEIYIHPQYNYRVYFNDIAVVKLNEPVDFSNFIRPCCLWEGDVSVDKVINKLGTVVGWGFDQTHKLSDNLMQAQMPIVSTITCIYSNREFFSQFTSERTYCAGFRNGTTVCNGDSGGGMFFPKPGTSGHNTIWQIRGLVSVGVALQGFNVCDASHYIVFTDVAKYLDWIKNIINN